jgi:4-hydroxy-2-oxoheptanedioate aldolase
MKTNIVKRKLREGKVSFGVWLSLGDLYASRLMARVGFDWLTLDMEHQPIDWSTAAAIFGAIADAGCVPIARVPQGNLFFVKQALDAGAWGIVAPMVNTAEEAKMIVGAAKYPPVGYRSLGGGLHAVNFATTPTEYYKCANEEILVVLQIESPTAVDNAEAICRVPGVDAVFVGPNDLRANMRRPDGTEATDAEFEAMIERVIAIGQKTGMPTGMHNMDAESAARRAKQGMQFVAVGSELRMMAAKAQEWLKAVTPEAESKEVAKY